MVAISKVFVAAAMCLALAEAAGGEPGAVASALVAPASSANPEAAHNDAKEGSKEGAKEGAKEGSKEGAKEGGEGGSKEGGEGGKEGAKEGKEGGKEGGEKKPTKKQKHWKLQHRATLAVSGCEQLLNKQATWFTGKTSNGAFCKKKNQPAMGLMMHCLWSSPNKKAKQAYIDGCKQFADLTLEDMEASYNNATQFLVYNPVKTVDGYNKLSIPPFPIGFEEKWYKVAYVSAIGRFYNLNYSMWFGIAMLCYWFGVLWIAGICNLFYYLFPNAVAKMNGTAVKLFRKYITLPALFRRQHVAHPPFLFSWLKWIVPTRLEAFLTLGYVAICIAGNLAYMGHVENTIYYDSKWKEGAKYVADRLGITVMWIIPQLILFAGRNNFMQWMLGWPYSRFINIHKWCSRMATILVLIHTVAYTIVGGGFHGAKFLQWYGTDWMIWGTVSLAAMSICCFHSLYSLRHWNYEVFLITHILMAVFFIVGGWIHCESQGYGEYYYAATAIWVLDRVVRIARLISFGARDAQVELMMDGTLRVTCARPSWWNARPGQHAFINFLRPTMFWQSHPFTIVEEALPADSAIGTHTMTMYLKVKGGVTHGLYKYLAQCPGNKATIKVAVEGPYGANIPLQKFDLAVFITGGHGIPGLYAQARDLLAKGASTHLKFVWIIPHYSLVQWFYPELQKLNTDALDTIIYVSRPEDQVLPICSLEETSLDSEEKKLDVEVSDDHLAQLKAKLSHIEFREGRPNITQLVAGEIADAPGTLAFTTCGHGDMVDEVRAAIGDNLMKSKHRVDLFEQAQIW